MYELAWARELFEQWPRANETVNPTPFQVVLRTVDPMTFLPDLTRLERFEAESPLPDSELLLWRHWVTFVQGDRKAGFRVLRQEAQARRTAESWLLLSAAGLLVGNRAVGLRALDRALRSDSRLRPLENVRQRFGVRRNPVLGFLPREHRLNIALGRLRARMNGS